MKFENFTIRCDTPPEACTKCIFYYDELCSIADTWVYDDCNPKEWHPEWCPFEGEDKEQLFSEDEVVEMLFSLNEPESGTPVPCDYEHVEPWLNEVCPRVDHNDPLCNLSKPESRRFCWAVFVKNWRNRPGADNERGDKN